MNFLHTTPFFRLLLPWIAGYLLSRSISLSDVSSWMFIIPVIFMVLIYQFCKKWFDKYENRWFFGLLLFAAVCCTSLLRSSSVNKDIFTPQADVPVGTYLVVVDGLPSARENVVVLDAQLLGCVDSQGVMVEKRGKVRLTLRVDSGISTRNMLHHGDQLLLNASLNVPQSASNPGGFDAAKYLRNQGIGAQSFVDAGKWKLLGSSSSIRRSAGFAAEKVISAFENSGMHGDELAVMSALILGIKDDLNDDLKLDYSRSGAMHILAVSGMHVAVIYMILNMMLGLVFRSDKLKIPKNLVIILFLWFYAFITGMSASVLRATVMFTFVASGFAIDRKSIIYNTISLSALVILMFFPNHILDPGLQLSYAAVIGIVYFQPRILKWLSPKNKMLRMAWEMTAVTLAAQIATLPVTLFYFNQFPNYFLLSNFLAVPLSTGIIYLAIVLLVVSPFSWLAGILGWLSQKAVHLLNALMSWVHHLPGSVTLVYISVFEMVMMYVALIFLMHFLIKKKFNSLITILSVVLIISLSGILRVVRSGKENQLVLFSDKKHTHLMLKEDQNAILWTTDSLKSAKIINPYLVYNQIDHPQIKIIGSDNTTFFFTFHGKRFCLVTGDEWKYKKAHKSLKIDVLLLGQGVKKSAENLLLLFKPELCVIGKGHSNWYSERIVNRCRELSVDTWLVAEKGAYIQNFFSNFADI